MKGGCKDGRDGMDLTGGSGVFGGIPDDLYSDVYKRQVLLMMKHFGI